MDIVDTSMESTNNQKLKLKSVAGRLAYEEGVDEAKAELERIAQELDQ